MTSKTEEQLRKALFALSKARSELKQKKSSNEPIAIIGMGARFPGKNSGVAGFKELLLSGENGVCDVPATRWNADQYHDPRAQVPGKMRSKRGGFLQIPIDAFDAKFFGISPKEAELMDPQQRLLLEVSYEAFLSAGIDPSSISNNKIGVFIGACNHDYHSLLTQATKTAKDKISLQMSTGNSGSVAAGRLSYYLGIQGPSMTVDTACSSSLVSVDLAIQKIRTGECTAALACGVNLLITPDTSISFSQGNLLSPDGLCKTFDARANGYVRGEGCGAILLKTYAQAKADGDPILAVIYASAVNQDGASSGLTVPNGEAQVALLKSALKKSGLSANDIDVIEAHGTGTSLGDPIEVDAISRVYSGSRDEKRPLYLASVKTNIGHLEGAAGIASIIKMVLALQAKKIPAHCHLQSLNPEIHLDTIPAVIPTKTIDWETGNESKKRYAGVSSFSLSGTNAHIILGEAPENYQSHRTALPAPEWQKKSYWFNIEEDNPTTASLSITPDAHPLLASRQRTPYSDDIVFQSLISAKSPDFLQGHQFFGSIIVAGASYISSMISGALQALEKDTIYFRNIKFERALIIPKEEVITYQLVIRKDEKTGKTLEVFSCDKHRAFTCHAATSLSQINADTKSLPDLLSLQQKCNEKIDVEAFLSEIDETKIILDKHYRWLISLYTGNTDCYLGKVRLPEGASEEKGYDFYPGLIDTGFHIGMRLIIQALTPKDGFYVPEAVEKFYFNKTQHPIAWVFAEHLTSDDENKVNIYFYTETGVIVSAMIGVSAVLITEQTVNRLQDMQQGVSWFTQPTWVESHQNKSDTNDLANKSILIFSDNNARANPLKGKLLQEKASVDILLATDCTIDEIISKFSNGHLTDIVFHWFDTIDHTGNLSAAYSALLSLIQALIKSGKMEIKLTVIYSDQLENALGQAPLIGLCRSTLTEYPELCIKQVFLKTSDESAIQTIVQEIAGTDVAEIKYWQNTRYIKQLQFWQEEKKHVFSVDNETQYVISGGLGGIGLAVAQWLSHHGAKHICLLSRRPAAESHDLEKLQASGTIVTTHCIDISDKNAVDDLFSKLSATSKSLAIFHAAGVLKDKRLVDQDSDDYAFVAKGKAQGAWYLHEASLKIENQVKYFVLFSSLSAEIGNQGQANYAAANCYCDALAHYRREQGLHALSINWGPWSEVGMATQQDLTFSARIKGVSNALGLSILQQALDSDLTQLIVAGVNWSEVLDLHPAHSLRFSKLIKNESNDKSQLLTALESALANERGALLRQHLEILIRNVLKLDDVEVVDRDRGLFDLGIDSLTAAEIKNNLQILLGRKAILPATLIFDYPSINQMADYLEQKVLPKILKDKSIKKKKPSTTNKQPESGCNFHHDPIAVIGMSCRLPGGADTPEAYWQLLLDGVDAICEIPLSRWDIDQYYDADKSMPGKTYTRFGGYVNFPIDEFDADFFNISPREANMMDPQQRLLLETSWEALERACIAPDSLRGSQTGVFVGISTLDYGNITLGHTSLQHIDAYCATGSSASIAAGRISYQLGLNGPSLPIDTACSSSLVTIHEACASLRSGEVNLALASAVNLLLLPSLNVSLSKAQMLSEDGRCKTFDASADGYVRAEGCGVLVLKRLSDAKKSGDNILAVIKGSAVNQDGASGGLTVPNGQAQEELIRRALNFSKLKPTAIDYVEAHGSGTSLGDPIEIRALANIFSDERDTEQPLVIGAVKSNIGHLEAAAGMAGILKAILCLENQKIPRNLHCHNLNPLIDLESIPAKLPNETITWQKNKERNAGVSGFAFNGTNAHIILGDDVTEPQADEQRPWPWHIISISAKTEEAFLAYIANIENFIQQHQEINLADLCYSFNIGRNAFSYRKAWVISDLAMLKENLNQAKRDKVEWLPEKETSSILLIQEKPVHLSSEFVDELTAAHPVFAQAWQACGATSDTYTYAFACGYSLATLLSSWGIKADAMVLMNSALSAVLMGVLPLSDGLKLNAILNSPSENQFNTLAEMLEKIELDMPECTGLSPETMQKLDITRWNASDWLENATLSINPDILLTLKAQHTIGIELDNIKSSHELLQQISMSYQKGADIDWSSFYSGNQAYRKKLVLPTHPFIKKRYWFPEQLTRDQHTLAISADRQKGSLLTHHFRHPHHNEINYESTFNLNNPEFVRDHCVHQVPIIAGATYLAMMQEIIDEQYAGKSGMISDIEFITPLVVSKENDTIIRSILTPVDGKQDYQIAFYSEQDINQWCLLVKARIHLADTSTLEFGHKVIADIKNNITAENNAQFYEAQQHSMIREELGFNFGKHFTWIDSVIFNNSAVLAKLRPPSLVEKQYKLYPGMIDACFQALMVLVNDLDPDKVRLPWRIGSFSISQNITPVSWVYATFSDQEKITNTPEIDIWMLSDDGQVVAKIGAFVTKEAPKKMLQAMLSSSDDQEKYFYYPVWKKQRLAQTDLELNSDRKFLWINQTIPQLKKLDSEHCKWDTLPDSIEQYTDLVYCPSQLLDASSPEQACHENIRQLFICLQHIQEKSQEKPIRLWLLTVHNEAVVVDDKVNLTSSGLQNFVRSIQLENQNWQIHWLDIDENASDTFIHQELMACDDEHCVAYRDEERFVLHILTQDQKQKEQELCQVPDRRYQLSVGKVGLLDSLHFSSDNNKPLPGDNEVDLEIFAAALNYRDVLNVMGLYPGDAGFLGGDCAGIVAQVGSAINHLQVGDRVFGMLGDCFGSHTIGNASVLVKMPDNMSFSEAATLPTVYLTAYIGLLNIAQLKAGETVLLHSASGGVGLAGIALARYVGANIIVTAGSDKKRNYLMSQGLTQVFDSRNVSFKDEILSVTKGRGVDVVLNFLTDDLLPATADVTCKGGRFIEIGKRGIWSQQQMQEYRSDIDYHIFALDDMVNREPQKVCTVLKQLVELYEDKKITPLPYSEFDSCEVIPAFRYMQQAKHIGKVILSRQSSTCMKETENGGYLITGGLGGLGLALIAHLAEKGARYFIVTTRKTPDNTINSVLQNLENQYKDLIIKVQVVTVSDETAMNELTRWLIQETQHNLMPPLTGIFHLAGMTRDALFANQSWDDTDLVLGPKVSGSWLLHQLSEKYQQETGYTLSDFVLFSSVASLMGSAGQSNYSAANGFMDALAEYRIKNGLPGLSINWGPWADIGMASSLEEQHQKSGIKAMHAKDALAAFDTLLEQNLVAKVGVADINWQKVSDQWSYWPSHLKKQRIEKKSDDALFKKLDTASAEEQAPIICMHIKELLQQVLNLASVDDVNEKENFFDMGMDSLMAVELNNKLQNSFGDRITLSMTNILSESNCLELSAHIGQLLSKQTAENNTIASTYLSIYHDKLPRQFDVMHHTDVAGNEIEYLVIGHGEPVLILSPLDCLHTVWAEFLHRFDDRYQLIMPHYPGVGASHFTEAASRIDNILALFSQIKATLKISEPWHVFGWSMGGVLAQIMASMNDAEIKSLVLFNVTPIFNDDITDFNYNDRTNLFATLSTDLKSHPIENPEVFSEENISQFISSGMTAEVVDFYLNNINLKNKQLFFKQPIQAPTLFIAGSKDTIMPASEAEVAMAKFTNYQYHTISGAGHFAALVKPEVCCRTVDAFLKNTDF